MMLTGFGFITSVLRGAIIKLDQRQWDKYATHNHPQFGTFRDEGLFRVGITLANIGTFGTSLNAPGIVQ